MEDVVGTHKENIIAGCIQMRLCVDGNVDTHQFDQRQLCNCFSIELLWQCLTSAVMRLCCRLANDEVERLSYEVPVIANCPAIRHGHGRKLATVLMTPTGYISELYS